jgi:hypothetical protein
MLFASLVLFIDIMTIHENIKNEII